MSRWTPDQTGSSQPPPASRFSRACRRGCRQRVDGSGSSSGAFDTTPMRLIAFAITMGLFSSLFGCKRGGGDGRFQTDEAYTRNRAKQLAMTPQTVAQLPKYEVTAHTQLKLEYFFYTNTKEKAAALAQKL